METVQASAELKAPLYDLPTAVEVLATRGYRKLPAILEKPHILMGTAAPRPPLDAGAVAEAKARLNEVIRLRLMWSKIPTNFEVPIVENGQVLLRVEDSFEATLTLLSGVTTTAPWTLIGLKFYVAPDMSFGDNFITADYNRRVEGIAAAAMAACESDPLSALYSVAISFTQNMQLDLLHSQVEAEKSSIVPGADPNSAASAQQQSQLTQQQSSKNKVLAQLINYQPGEYLDLTFSSGFRLRFSANGPTITTNPSNSAANNLANGEASSSTRSGKKSKRDRSRRTRGATAANGPTTTTTTRGVALSLKEKRQQATKLTIESFPAIVDPLTGDLAVYEVDPRSVDLETIVSRAKRMYAHEKLQVLADQIQTQISASRDALEARIATTGIEPILEDTDAEYDGELGANFVPLSPSSERASGGFDAPLDASYTLLSLTPDDVSVHINRGLLKSYIVIRLFENHAAYLQLSSTDGKPQLVTPCLDMKATVVNQIQRQLQNLSKDPTGSILASVLQHLQRHAILYSMRRIAASLTHPLTTGVVASAIPNHEFLRQFGPHHLCLHFQDDSMGQSRLIVALDHLKVKLTEPSKTLENGASRPPASLNSSISSVAHIPSTNGASGRWNDVLSRNAQGGSNDPILAVAYTPIRMRFFLLPNSTPATYKLHTAIRLAVPSVLGEEAVEELLVSDAPGASAASANGSSSHILDVSGTSNSKGLKRASELSSAAAKGDSEKPAQETASTSAPEAKRAKLAESAPSAADDLDSSSAEKHKMRPELTESTGNVNPSSSASMAVDSASTGLPRYESLAEVRSRTEAILARRETSLEWFGILTEISRASGSLVTRALLLGDLDRTHAQYTPYGTGVSGVAVRPWENARKWSLAYELHRYSAQPLQIQQLVIHLDDAKWSVTLTESESLLPPSLKVAPSVSLSGSVHSTRYNPNTKEWKFVYPRATPLNHFFLELRGLAFLHKLFVQFLTLTQLFSPPGYNSSDHLFTPLNAELSSPSSANLKAAQLGLAQSSNSTLNLNFFRLIAFSPSHITFAYGDNVHNAALTPSSHSKNGQKANGNLSHSGMGSSASNLSTNASHSTSATQDKTNIRHAVHIYWKGGARLGSPASTQTPLVGASPFNTALDSPPFLYFEPEDHLLGIFMNAHLETWLNEPNLRFLFEMIWNNFPVLSSVKRFIEYQKGTLRSNDLLIIPQSAMKLRMFFRQWGIDWRFLGNRFVCIEEVRRQDDTLSMLNFIPFIQGALQRIVQTGASDGPEFTALISNSTGDGTSTTTMELSRGPDMHNTLTPGSGTGTHSTPGDFNMDVDGNSGGSRGDHGGASGSGWSAGHGSGDANDSATKVAELLAKQKTASAHFVGPTFVVFHAELTAALLPQLHAYFGSMRLFLTVERDDAPRVKRTQNEKGEFVLPFRPHPDCEVSLILRKPTYMLDVIFPSTIGQDEVELLAQLLRTKVIAPPYRTAHLLSFLAIFSLPPSSLSDFIALLRYARDRSGITLQLNFSPKDTVQAPIAVHQDANTADCTITLSLLFTNMDTQPANLVSSLVSSTSSYAPSGSPYIIMTISYSYKTRRLTATDHFALDFLTRNEINTKSYGSLAGAAEAIVRTLQRSWAHEYSRFAARNPHLVSAPLSVVPQVAPSGSGLTPNAASTSTPTGASTPSGGSGAGKTVPR